MYNICNYKATKILFLESIIKIHVPNEVNSRNKVNFYFKEKVTNKHHMLETLIVSLQLLY